MNSLITLTELCQRLAISRSTYNRMKRADDFPQDFPQPVELFGSGKLRFSSADVDRFIDSHVKAAEEVA